MATVRFIVVLCGILLTQFLQAQDAKNCSQQSKSFNIEDLQTSIKNISYLYQLNMMVLESKSGAKIYLKCDLGTVTQDRSTIEIKNNFKNQTSVGRIKSIATFNLFEDDATSEIYDNSEFPLKTKITATGWNKENDPKNIKQHSFKISSLTGSNRPSLTANCNRREKSFKLYIQPKDKEVFNLSNAALNEKNSTCINQFTLDKYGYIKPDVQPISIPAIAPAGAGKY
jgi:hypothetical protein